jgi:DNA-binding LacI/PurR family transcriptional regulator
MTSIYNIAKVTGVNVSTVSRVLNNQTKQVSAETRERILQAVRDLGYKPTRPSRKASGNVTLTFGVLCATPAASYAAPGYYGSVYHAILKQCDLTAINLTVFASKLFYMDPHDSIRTYCDGRCDGIILLQSNDLTNLSTILLERGFPTVIIGDKRPEETVSWCDIDNFQSGYDCARELIELGHERIAICSGNRFRCATDRISGFIKAMSESDLPIKKEWISLVDVTEDSVSAWLSSVAAPNKGVTGVIALSDPVASLVINVAKSQGLEVPSDLSVIGFDDTLGDTSPVPLTTIRQPYEDMAKWATEALRLRIVSANTVSHQIFAGELIRRQSAAPPIGSAAETLPLFR